MRCLRLLPVVAVLIALACFARLTHQKGIAVPGTPAREDGAAAGQPEQSEPNEAKQRQNLSAKAGYAATAEKATKGAAKGTRKNPSGKAAGIQERPSIGRRVSNWVAGIFRRRSADQTEPKRARRTRRTPEASRDVGKDEQQGLQRGAMTMETNEKQPGGTHAAAAVHEGERSPGSESTEGSPCSLNDQHEGGDAEQDVQVSDENEHPHLTSDDKKAAPMGDSDTFEINPEVSEGWSSDVGLKESDGSFLTHDDSWIRWMYGDAEDKLMQEASTLEKSPGDLPEESDNQTEDGGKSQTPPSWDWTPTGPSDADTGNLHKALQGERNVANAARDATKVAFPESSSSDEESEEEEKAFKRVIRALLPPWAGPADSQTGNHGVRGPEESRPGPESPASAVIENDRNGKPKAAADPTPGHQERPANQDSDPGFRVVPASLSMANSWWAVSEGEATSNSFLIDASSEAVVFKDKSFPLEAGNVVENHDMRNFGVVRAANVVAYRHQMACRNFHTTAHLMNELPSMYGVVCTITRLTAFAEDAAAGLHVPVNSAAVRALAKVSSAANARKHAIEVALAIRKHIADAASRQDSLNLGLLLNSVMMEHPSLRPVCSALIMMLFECRATLPYPLRAQNGFPVLPPEDIPKSPYLRHMNQEGADIRIPADAPTAFPITIVAQSGGSTFDGANRDSPKEDELWRQPIYKAFSILWFFVMHMYHLGERFDVYKSQHVDEVFPSPWRLVYVGTALWTEWVPFHDAKSQISPGGMEALEKYKLKTSWKRVPYSLKKQLFVEETPETPKQVKGVLRPFNVDQCDRDATYATTDASPLVALLEKRPNAAETPAREPAGDEHTLKMHDVEAVWILKGTDGVKQWILNGMLQAIHDPAFSETGLIHQGFSSHFHQTLRRPLTRFLSKAATVARKRTPANPYVVALAGHSLGGSLALLGTWFLAKNLKPFLESGQLVIYSVVYGSPSIGDAVAIRELNACGAKIFRIRIDLDPVPLMAQTQGVTKLYKDDNDDIVFRAEDMANVALWNPDGSLKYSGLVWLLDAVQPFRRRKKLLRFFARHYALPQFVQTYNNPLYTHLHLFPCLWTILTGMYEEYGWSSSCAAPLLRRYPLFPFILSAESEVEMKRVHEEELPGVLKRLEQRLKSESWTRKTQALIQSGLAFLRGELH
ncbi:putative lipase domain-containing protein [Neospora caninum Liverpool]|uniref:Lipase domain-containing protein, putative n=1 Tax=Neospora caninum (strain Liverpool) TaxID=572307 RepID=F0VJL7_NEOCL|nr:putative lipase domain-containing protein [Neospora caninum Liverpool]CBZ53928.1 putative lipase domain-containing protein [Neospora caninum Liverpool]CEL67926.1 TPA: lipase domain-containing protein, putative [Neospora caninum Liverpool]|eukprot:XP_003883960.1 putative lipase domain-containing protein [Neospora caninum Liverpool]